MKTVIPGFILRTDKFRSLMAMIIGCKIPVIKNLSYLSEPKKTIQKV
jgi:hypothetical protein